jgi:hypothetical protein
VAASRCCSPVPAPQPQPGKPAQMTLGTELNPHKTELNPHKAVPGGQSRSKAAPFRARRIARQHAADKGRAGGHVACDPRHP